ncbi:hypothetical protein AMJ47_03000 [Parcubacteria bacterium DG_72]|nr:MAG: hypothetical protein AMJ47_03000 [Parcubacteria bacterium DG_72]
MDYKSIRVNFLNNIQIKNKADLFRKEFWDSSIPVDIERIIDLKLKIDVIPFPNLQNSCDADAPISSDWKSIYVDKYRYLDDRYQNRLRFSFAHEIGHFVLHKDIYESFNIKTINDFYRFIEDFDNEQYGYLETQANKFANYLLVPREILIEHKKKIINGKDFLSRIDSKTLNSYLANPISNIFGISGKVAEIALNDLE